MSKLRPNISASELRSRIAAFEVASDLEKARQIAQLINSLLSSHEAAIMIDGGGALRDDGALAPELDKVIDLLEARPHPPLAIVSPRMTPARLRRASGDIAYAALSSLDAESSYRLLARLLKDSGSTVDASQMQLLLEHSDGHPFNFYQIAREVKERGAAAFLANPIDFIEWKHKMSSEYLSRVNLSDDHIRILAIMRLLPELDFETIVQALSINDAVVSEALLHLANLHIVEADGDRFALAPPIRIAVERDRRITISREETRAALKVVASSLAVRLEEGTAPVALVDSAVLAGVEVGTAEAGFASAFLLPSHFVKIAIRKYDDKKYGDCLTLVLKAIERVGRLSRAGYETACTYMCLSSARIGDDETFDRGLSLIREVSSGDRSKSNIKFLLGFRYRLKGRLPEAESELREAIKLSPRNTSAIREIASVLLALGKVGDAEAFARDSYAQAPSNPYFVDILLTILINKFGHNQSNSEIDDLFSVLERVGEEDGHSFYTTRKAEYELNRGNVRQAVELARVSVEKTPNLFEPKRIYVEALLRDGNKSKAREILNAMRAQVDSRGEDRRTHYRAFLETESHYLEEVGQFADAKKIYEDRRFFTEMEAAEAKRKIEIAESFRARGRR